MLFATPNHPGRLTLLGRVGVFFVALFALQGANCAGENAMVARMIVEIGEERRSDEVVTCRFSEATRSYVWPSCFGWECDPSCGPVGSDAIVTPATCPELEGLGVDEVEFRVRQGALLATLWLIGGGSIPGEVTSDFVNNSGRDGPRFDVAAERVVFRGDEVCSSIPESDPSCCFDDACLTLDLRDLELHGVLGVDRPARER